MRERLKAIIGELRDLVERAQASLDDRPVLQAALDALRTKVNEAEDEDEQIGPGAAGRIAAVKDDHRVVLGLIAIAVICAVVVFVFSGTAGGTVLI